MTALILNDMSESDRARFEKRPRRLSALDLFRIGPNGLEDISDETLNRRLDELELGGEVTLSQISPLEAVRSNSNSFCALSQRRRAKLLYGLIRGSRTPITASVKP